jgi:hypothetical protein
MAATRVRGTVAASSAANDDARGGWAAGAHTMEIARQLPVRLTAPSYKTLSFSPFRDM